MHNLWAPWRIKYIEAKKETGCLFCRVAKEKRDRKNQLVFRSNYCFVLLNRFPYNNGHVMIAPYKHTAKLEKLSAAEAADIHKTTIKVKKALDEILCPNAFNAGFNLGKTAGAGMISHIHMHLVPRWEGDTNFMPVISGTKVISQNLNQLYCQLKEILK